MVTAFVSSSNCTVLDLGAVKCLYQIKDNKRDYMLLWQVLDTFSQHLCSAGLIEKGLTGELGAQMLLLLARDFAAPERIPNLLKPVPLLDVIDTLFGNKSWVGIDEH